MAQGQKGLTARLTGPEATGPKHFASLTPLTCPTSRGDPDLAPGRGVACSAVPHLRARGTGSAGRGPVQSAFTAVPVPFAMKMRLIPFALVLAVATVLAVAAPAVRAAEGQRPIAVAAASVSMEQAVKMAEQRFKARVVRAETQHDDGHIVYVLRMLNESGRVWTVRVDASNGALL